VVQSKFTGIEMLSIFKKEILDSNEKLKEKIYAESQVGNLVPVNLMGDTNGYYVISGYEHKNNVLIAPVVNTTEVSETIEVETIDGSPVYETVTRIITESESEYITRLKPVSLQGFYDLATGAIEAIVLTNEQLKLLMKQPEFKA